VLTDQAHQCVSSHTGYASIFAGDDHIDKSGEPNPADAFCNAKLREMGRIVFPVRVRCVINIALVPDPMAQLLDRAGPVMRGRAGLDSNQARLPGEEGLDLRAAELTTSEANVRVHVR